MLDQIPLELLIEIVKHLSWKDIYSLRQVNKYLYQTLFKNKEVRKTILRKWQLSNPCKTWKYHYYGHKVYRILRWKFHQIYPKKSIVCPSPKEIKSNKKDLYSVIHENGYYNGLNIYPTFSCVTLPQENIDSNGDFIIFGRATILLNLIIEGGYFYEIFGNDTPFFKGTLCGKRTILWFNDFAGIPICSHPYTRLTLRVYSKSKVNVIGTFAYTDNKCWDYIKAHPCYDRNLVYINGSAGSLNKEDIKICALYQAHPGTIFLS